MIFEQTDVPAKNYLLDIDKGPLTYPSEYVVKIFVVTFQNFQFLLQEEEEIFKDF